MPGFRYHAYNMALNKYVLIEQLTNDIMLYNAFPEPSELK